MRMKLKRTPIRGSPLLKTRSRTRLLFCSFLALFRLGEITFLVTWVRVEFNFGHPLYLHLLANHVKYSIVSISLIKKY